MPPITTTAQEESLSTLCTLCHSRPPRYRCPACSTKTCSVACVQKHKLYAQCSGQVSATAFVKRSALLSSPATLNRDFGFLRGVERVLGAASEEQEGRGDGGERERERERLEGFLRRSGVRVKWAPRGMKRAAENRTAVSKGRGKGRHVVWTVEWVVIGAQEGEAGKVLDVNVSELTTLLQAYFHPTPPPSFSSSSITTTVAEEEDSQPPRKKIKRNNPAATPKRTKFYLKKIGCPANSPVLIKLDGTKSLSVALRGRVVEEFPTIMVWSGEGDPAGYVIESGVLIEVIGEVEEVKAEEVEMGMEGKGEAAPVQEQKQGLNYEKAEEVKEVVADERHQVQESQPDLTAGTEIPEHIEHLEEDPVSTSTPAQPIPTKLNDIQELQPDLTTDVDTPKHIEPPEKPSSTPALSTTPTSKPTENPTA